MYLISTIKVESRCMYMADLKRLNTNVPRDIYEWIDEESKRTGVMKSAIVYIALKTYIDQQRTLNMVSFVEAQQLMSKQLDVKQEVL